MPLKIDKRDASDAVTSAAALILSADVISDAIFAIQTLQPQRLDSNTLEKEKHENVAKRHKRSTKNQ